MINLNLLKNLTSKQIIHNIYFKTIENSEEDETEQLFAEYERIKKERELEQRKKVLIKH